MAGLLDSVPDAQHLDSPLLPSSAPKSVFDGVPAAPAPHPLEDSYRTAFDVEPDHAARVITTVKKTGFDPVFTDANIDVAAKVAAAPAPDFWARLEREHPGTSRFLLSENNMAVAKDDLDNLTAHESAVREFGGVETMYRALNSGLARMNANIARIPAAIYDVAAIPQNAVARVTGLPIAVKSPDWLINNPGAKFYDAQAAAAAVPEMEADSVAHIANGEYAKAGRVLAAQFAASAPNTAAMVAAHLAGFPVVVGAGGAGFMQAADVNARGRAQGVDALTGAINAVAHGTIEAGFESFGTFGIMKHWEGVIARSYGKKVAREVLKDMGKTLAASVAGEANEEALTSAAQDLSDYLTGVNPRGLEGIGRRSLNAALVGGLSGGVFTAGGAIMSGTLQARASEVRAAERAKEFYLALADTSRGSKLRARLPEQHRKLIEEITKDGPSDAVFIDAAAAEQYFQSAKLNATEEMEKLGAGDSFLEAKRTGGLVRIPTAKMTRLIEDGHYAALADDIKFDPGGYSVNEATARIQEIKSEQAKFQATVEGAVKADAKVQAGYDLVISDVKTKLLAIARPDGISESDWPKVIETQAAAIASLAVVTAQRRGISVEEYYQVERRPDIASAQELDLLKPAEETLLQKALTTVKVAVGEIVGKPATPQQKEIARIEKFLKNVQDNVKLKQQDYPGLMEDFLQKGDGRVQKYGDELHSWAEAAHRNIAELTRELQEARDNPNKAPTTL